MTNHPTTELLEVTLDVEAAAGDNNDHQLNSDADEDEPPAAADNDDSRDSAPPTMQITPEHPVYVEGKGWLWAENLSIGDTLRRADGGMAKVLAIDRLELEEPQRVYNFTVKGPHTYFVLDVGVLVHNVGCDLENNVDPRLAELAQINQPLESNKPPSSFQVTNFPGGILSPEHQAEVSDFVTRFQNAQKPIADVYSFRRVTQGMFSDTHNAGRSLAAWTEYKRTNQSNGILVLGRRDDVRPWDKVTGYLTLTNPKWSLRVNDAWMQGGIDRGATFFLVSPLRLEVLSDISSRLPYTVTARELEQLRLANYTFLFKDESVYLVPKYR